MAALAVLPQRWRCNSAVARVTVFEQAAELTEVGAGLQISENGMVVLRALGIAGRYASSRRVEAPTEQNCATTGQGGLMS